MKIITLILVGAFTILDCAAFTSSKKQPFCFYHWLPGGGFVRYYQAMKLTIILLLSVLLTGCSYTNRKAYNQGWIEGYKKADQYRHSEK